MAKKLFSQTIASQRVDIFKDEVANSIILVGKPDNNAKMIRYIKQLDVKGESIEQKLYVIRLKNSNVEEMEKILSKLITQMNNLSSSNNTKKGKKPQKAMVVSDVERNALIILATSEQMKNIRKTVSQIDIPKVQVYVKSKIVEIDTNKAKQIGIQYGLNGGTITSSGLYTLATNMGASALQMSPQLLSFLNLNNKHVYTDNNGNIVENNEPAFKFDSTDKVFALGAQLDLLKRHGAAHILSEPSILCTNNKEATIYVGQTMSILTKAQQSTQGQGNIVNSYSREDIGITLKVKPRLSSNNKVSLEVETKIEDVDPSSEQVADRPTTTKRKVVTNAIVNNGETIILGGLMKKVGGRGANQIPILGEIPIIGDIFFTHSSNVEREQNVVIYLTPYIVRKSSDLEKLKKILEELDKVQERYNAIVERNLEHRPKKRTLFSFFGNDEHHTKTKKIEEKHIDRYVEKQHNRRYHRTPHKISNGHLKNLELLDSLEEEY
jgi:general secretion pathway protein D